MFYGCAVCPAHPFILVYEQRLEIIMSYKPRRAGKRWMEDAPAYVLSVHDNKGQTADQYTVYFGGEFILNDGPDAGPGTGPGNTYIQYLAMSTDPTSPQGVSIWGEMWAYERSSRQRIRWLDLPEHIRQHVIARAMES
jgi:hypothetical protein